VGAAAGAVGEGLSECGVDEGFIKQIDDLLRPGRAAPSIAPRHIDGARSQRPDRREACVLGRAGAQNEPHASLENRLQQAFEEARALRASRSGVFREFSTRRLASAFLRRSFVRDEGILLFSAACGLIPSPADYFGAAILGHQ